MTQKKKSKNRIIPDTSVVIDGKLSELIQKDELDNVEIIIPEMVLDELQAQANKGLEIGFEGLDEIKKLRKLSEKKNIEVKHTGRRPTEEEIRLAKKGRIDALIRDAAKEKNATLYTEDLVQSEVAKAEGLEVVYIEPEKEETLLLEKYFTKNTMSVHLKEKATPYAKRGKPGNFELEKLEDVELEKNTLEKISRNIIQVARQREDSHFEISKRGAEVIQLGDYRIVIAKPPFSKGMEITAVRPIVKLSLDDYSIPDKLRKRLEERAEGVLISGPPGSGKTTLGQALAEFYSSKGKIVKTLESPRDLRVEPEITQYTELNGRMDNSADILLLLRPDYTIYDEIRKGYDFSVFTDLRLAGVGMVGVVHATDPVDAVQRFVGRTELGMIPHVLDTIIYVKGGDVIKVYSLNLKVKVPSGMKEEDLARPVVEIRDFETENLEYEIYTYGEENVVVPVEAEKERSVEKLAKEKIYEEIKKFDKNPEIEFIAEDRIKVYVENENIPKLIGKNGRTIDKIEKRLGIGIDVEPKVKHLGKEIDFKLDETGGHIIFKFGKKLSGENANIYIDDEYFFTATIGKNGEIRITKASDLGERLISAIGMKKEIKVFI